MKMVSAGATTVFVYDAMGNLAGEYSDAASDEPGTRYVTTDQLGSIRMTTADGDPGNTRRFDYEPFGKELVTSNRTLELGYGQPGPRPRFTGQERDPETISLLDFYQARYYTPAPGRFASPDEPLAGQDPGDPQSWNLFAYARNNPLLYVDPTGRDWEVCTDQSSDQSDPERNRRVCQQFKDAQFAEWRGDTVKMSPGGTLTFESQGIRTQIGEARYYNPEQEQADLRGAAAIASWEPVTNVLGAAALAIPAIGTTAGAILGGGSIMTLAPLSAPAAAGASPTVQATIHGAERLAERGFSAADVALTKTGRVLTQTDGAKVYIKAVGDRFNVIVEGERGVVTALKNISRQSLDRLSQNYGWK